MIYIKKNIYKQLQGAIYLLRIYKNKIDIFSKLLEKVMGFIVYMQVKKILQFKNKNKNKNGTLLKETTPNEGEKINEKPNFRCLKFVARNFNMHMERRGEIPY
jgi:hypothetical protein